MLWKVILASGEVREIEAEVDVGNAGELRFNYDAVDSEGAWTPAHTLFAAGVWVEACEVATTE